MDFDCCPARKEEQSQTQCIVDRSVVCSSKYQLRISSTRPISGKLSTVLLALLRKDVVALHPFRCSGMKRAVVQCDSVQSQEPTDLVP
mgnify:CR=1 FL=1